MKIPYIVLALAVFLLNLNASRAFAVLYVSENLARKELVGNSLCVVVEHRATTDVKLKEDPTNITEPLACQFRMKASWDVDKKGKHPVSQEMKSTDMSFVVPYEGATRVCFSFDEQTESLYQKLKSQLKTKPRVIDYAELDTACVGKSKTTEVFKDFSVDSRHVFVLKSSPQK